MKILKNPVVLFGLYFALIALVAIFQSLSLALTILTLGLISSIMAMGVNMQWGYAGLLNVGSMGFAAIGGGAAIWISAEPVTDAWAVGGPGILMALFYLIATALAVHFFRKYTKHLPLVPAIGAFIIIIIGYFLVRQEYVVATQLIEEVNPASQGYLGGLGLPIHLSWIVGGALAAAVAWFVGKISLGLKEDYLAIATLGISEIVVAVLKNEDWLTRGVKNVVGLPRPVPYEIDLESKQWVIDLADTFGMRLVDMTSVIVRLNYIAIFAVILVILLWLANRAIKSPWGRMMWAIRDNEVAASAMGKDVKRQHLIIFILGSAVVGFAGALLTTLEGQFTPGSYNPLRFTFLIWIMVIIGGSGNNWGSILGGLIIWLFWVEAEPIGTYIVETASSIMAEDNPVRVHLVKNAAQMRLTLMGLLLLFVLRFNPKGLIPEKNH